MSLYIKDKGDLISSFLFFEQLQFIKFVYDRNNPTDRNSRISRYLPTTDYIVISKSRK